MRIIIHKKAQLENVDPTQQPVIPPPVTTEEVVTEAPVGVDQIGPGAVEKPMGITTDIVNWTKGRQDRYYLQLIDVPSMPKDPFMMGMGYKFSPKFKAW